MNSQVSRVWTWEFPNFHFLWALRSHFVFKFRGNYKTYYMEGIVSQSDPSYDEYDVNPHLSYVSILVPYKKHVLASSLCNWCDQNWADANCLVLVLSRSSHDLSFDLSSYGVCSRLKHVICSHIKELLQYHLVSLWRCVKLHKPEQESDSYCQS
jgi:hypothetical protein